jgi:hypothetical protein
MFVRDFEPDWTKRWTAREAEEQLHNFKFSGPGWYLSPSDTLLVVPDSDVEYAGSYKDRVEKGPWRGKWPEDQLFWFIVYNGRDPSNSFNALANAPVRQDDRT